MREVHLKDCRILIGTGLIEEVGPRVTERLGEGGRAFVITDSNTQLYGRYLAAQFIKTGAEVVVYSVPAGESAKNLKTVRKIYDAMLKHRMERGSPVLGVGGGVVTDIAGFAASTYMRGVPVVMFPTTLLAQVDAAIGGKTGVDHGGLKNIVGTFHQPEMVIIDPLVLRTLPDHDYSTGLAEVIKYGVIHDAPLFRKIQEKAGGLDYDSKDADLLTDVIAKCVKIKADVVSKDEKEGGRRAILNFGHTVGHAIESVARFGVSHGEAVAAGMVHETQMAVELGMTAPETRTRIESAVERFGLPTRIDRRLPPLSILEAMQMDKKVKNGRPRFVLPEKIGSVKFGVEVPREIVAKSLTIQ